MGWRIGRRLLSRTSMGGGDGFGEQVGFGLRVKGSTSGAAMNNCRDALECKSTRDRRLTLQYEPPSIHLRATVTWNGMKQEGACT